MSMVLAWMMMVPGFPAPLVSVVRLVLWFRSKVWAWISMLPAFPLPSVSAWSLLWLVS